MNPDDVLDKIAEIQKRCYEKKNQMLKMLAAAFIEETGFNPSECELVEQRGNGEVTYFFRKREPVKQRVPCLWEEV